MASLRTHPSSPVPSTEWLLDPVSEAQPTGHNLEYESEFAELELAARGKPARQMGEAVAPGEPANFVRVIELASGLLQRSKDLRIAVQLARGLLETEGFAGLADGLYVTRGLLERYWDALYPELDPDEQDAMMRRAALSALGAPEWITAVRCAPLLGTARFGAISLRDVTIATGELHQPPRHTELDADVIAGSFRAAPASELQTLVDQVEVAREHLKAIDAALASSSGSGTDLRNLDRVLHQVSMYVRPFLERSAASTMAPVSEAREMTTAVAPAVQGSIQRRQDVIHWLDRICAYYAQHEPSSPLPLLLQRCRRLVSSSFLEIVRDLAPEALSQIRTITGKTEEARGDEA